MLLQWGKNLLKKRVRLFPLVVTHVSSVDSARRGSAAGQALSVMVPPEHLEFASGGHPQLALAQLSNIKVAELDELIGQINLERGITFTVALTVAHERNISNLTPEFSTQPIGMRALTHRLPKLSTWLSTRPTTPTRLRPGMSLGKLEPTGSSEGGCSMEYK